MVLCTLRTLLSRCCTSSTASAHFSSSSSSSSSNRLSSLIIFNLIVLTSLTIHHCHCSTELLSPSPSSSSTLKSPKLSSDIIHYHHVNTSCQTDCNSRTSGQSTPIDTSSTSHKSTRLRNSPVDQPQSRDGSTTTTTNLDTNLSTSEKERRSVVNTEDKYAPINFHKRTLKQFVDDMGFNFAPQVDMRDFSRVMPYQSFPQPQGPPPPPMQPSRGFPPEDIGDYPDIDPNVAFNRDAPPPPPPQRSPPPPPESPSINFAPRQSSFQRVRIPQPQSSGSQQPPLPPPPPPASSSSSNSDRDVDDRHSSSPANDAHHEAPRFQRIRRPSIPDRSERPPIPPPLIPENNDDSPSPPVSPNRSPSSGQQFRRLPINRNRPPVSREPEERLVRRPSVIDSDETTGPLRPSINSEEFGAGPPSSTARPRRVKPTSNGSRRIRPVNRNRINGNDVNRSPVQVNPLSESIVPTAVVITKPPQTPVPVSSEDVETEIGGRLPPSRETPIRNGAVRLRRPINGNGSGGPQQPGFGPRRRVPKPSIAEIISSTRFGPESSVAPDEESAGNNAVDSDVNGNAIFGSKIRDDPVALTKTLPLSTGNNGNGPIVVDYMTVFTYLTTVIRGPHTLVTSHESTTRVHITQPYDPSIVDIVSNSAGVIRPTKTVNLGTKTKGPTTTIVNMQSNVQIANFEFVSGTVKPNRIPQPSRTSSSPAPELRRTRKPIIETAPKHAANILKADQLRTIPKTFYTQHTYFYTVYDGAKTRRSTRSELITARVPETENVATLTLDSTINSDGLLSLGSGPSTVNIGKRVFGGSTTEVNLAMKTYLKLDGIQNAVIEPSATRQPYHSLSHEITIRPTEPNRGRPTLPPTLEASTPPLIESGLSSLPELDQPESTPIIIPISSDIRNFRTRRPVRVSSTAVNPDTVRSRAPNGRFSQRVRPRPNFSRIQRPKLSSPSLDSEYPPVISSSFSPELESLSSLLAASSSDILNLVSPTASISGSEVLESDAISSAIRPKASSSVRRPYTNNALRSRLRRPPRPQATSEPKYVIVTRSASSPSTGPSSSPSLRSSKSRYRVASRIVRPGSSPVDTSLSSPVVTDIESIIPSSSVLVTYISTTTHTVPFTMNDKTLMTTFEETNSRIATEPLDQADANRKVTRISDGVTLLMSGNIEPTSPITLRPTLVSGAAVHMRDGLKDKESHNDNVNRDMETKTVFTTYTYFTTFYSGSSSKVSSSEQVVSNVITQPKATQILPTSSIRPPVTIVETSEKIETSTIYSTYTYFATLFNGSRSTITPIEETRSEILTLREPIRITRTINPAGPSATNSLFTRTYYTTYTKAFTFTENNVPKTSRKEEVVSNVVTFTLSGHRETPALDMNRIYTTQTINQLSAYPSLLTTKSTYVTSTHFITLFNGSQTILSSVEEIAPTVVTQIIGQPSAANNQRIPYSRIQSNIVPSSSISIPQKSRDLMTALSPSISTLHITHTYYTTYFNGHTSTVESRTEATSSLVTLYVPQNGKQSTGSAPAPSAINGRDQMGSVFKSGDYNIQSTPVLPNQLRSSVDNIPYRKRGSTVSPSLQSTRRVDQFESSILSRVVESLKASQGLSDEQISSAIFGGHGMGKSTTVIGGSTVVFFTDLILSPSSSSVFGVKSTISPSKTIEFNGEGTAIKPGTVIELSDLLGGHANANLPGGLGSAIKDIVHLIASNSNGANNNKFNESMVDFDSDDHMPPGGMVKVKPDLEPVYIPIGGKHKSSNNSPVNVDGGSGSSSSSSDTSRSDGEPVYRPDLTLEESGSSSSSSSSSFESSSSSSSSSDESGRNGGYMRKNDIYHRKNQNLLESSHRSHPQLASSINSVGSSPSSGSSGYETTPLSNSGSAHTQVQGGATTIFFTDGLESSMINIGGQQPSLSTTPTRYITSVESMTRTLTLTTTKVYYTRDSPLTITSELTTTIPPRTFVSTIIGSRTILGTAGEATKTVDVDSKSASNDEVTTTVTTTTLIFNSITTTVVRTLVIPTAIQATRTTPVSTRPSRKPYTPYRPPRPSTTPPSVSIRPPGSRTRSPYLAKYKPSTPRPTSPSPSDSETMNTLSDSDDTTKITSVPPKLFDDDQCKPACNTANKEICREIDGIFRCECRPGYARKEGSTVCEAMQVYLLVVRLMKVGENPVSYNTDLSDSSSGEYQKIARLAKEEIEKAYRNTSIKDTYLGADVNMIKSPSDGDDGVLVNMTVHLAAPRGGFTTNGDGFDAENEFNLNDMHNELSRTLAISDKSSETLPNPSSIVADIETLEDFDECSDEKYNDCDLAARCINKPGSYVCECKGAYTDMDPNLPGRVCAAEIKNCEACHGRGDCVRSEDGEKTTCKCQRMYLGERCEINGLLLATFLPIAAVLSIVSVCCIVYCCRKYKKKSNYPKGFKNLVAYPPQTIGANTLDRKAMLETSSESSEHFRHAGHDGTNGMGHYPSGNGSTRRHGHPDMERSMGPGAFVAMPPQVTIPRARHLNQNSDGCENITMNPKSCMRDDMSNGHGAHHRESSPEQFSRDRESFSRQQGRQNRSQSRCGSRIGSRAESRSESRCNTHREEDFMAKDFIEWTPKRASFHEKACESERDQFSEHKAKSHRAFGDLRISPFDWQWKMLKQTSGSYSPNTRGKKKSLTDDRTPFGGSYIESPITSHKRRYHDTRDSQMEKSQHNLSLVSERDESVVSYSTTWTGGPAQYHVADDLISLERRSQVSNWGRLPFYDN